jgi:ADP-ribose pyrophosphatase
LTSKRNIQAISTDAVRASTTPAGLAAGDVSFRARPEAPPVRVEVTHTGPIIRVERLEYAERETASGVVVPAGFRDVVRHPGAVAVVAQKDDGTFVLVRNRRVAVAHWLVEFCAGKLERGEHPDSAAARELEEETGYRAERIEKLGAFFTSPGFADEVMHVYLATGLSPVPQRLEPGEELEVVEMDPGTLARQIASGAVTDGKTLGAYLLWTLRAGIPHVRTPDAQGAGGAA